MRSVLGPDQIMPMPDAASPAKAARRQAFRQSPPSESKSLGPALTLLRDLLAHQDEEFYGAHIHARTGNDNGILYAQLKRMERAGWLTSWLEIEESWFARAPVGCGLVAAAPTPSHAMGEPRRNATNRVTIFQRAVSMRSSVVPLMVRVAGR
ncbi:hypothetical protein ACKI1Q_39755 [Streptomyces galilaeus]|uniref:hypothetical protein n=1 Tax=Streptomyces galilaeus TaxID=33899 RepID=UPI0038F6ECA8